MIGLSLAILFASIWSAIEYFSEVHDDEEGAALVAMLITVGIGLIVGFAVYWFSRSDDDFLGRREALLLVALSWLWGAAVAALPFWLWAMFAAITPEHPFHSWIPCYFESMSGLTWKAMAKAAENDPALAKRVKHYLYRAPFEFYDYESDRDALKNLIESKKHGELIAQYGQELLKIMSKTKDHETPNYRKALGEISR